MGKGLRYLVAIGLSVAGLRRVLGPGVALAGTQDQQQSLHDGNGLSIANDSFFVAQTFTAGISGKLDQVDLALSKNGSPGPLTVEIRNVSGGSPATTVLASTGLDSSAVTAQAPPGATVPVTFSAPATVAAGTQYAIVASNPSTGLPNLYGWYTSLDCQSLRRGHSVYRDAPAGTSWTPVPSGDLAFTTYVVPAATGPTGPTGQRAAALKKCKKKHSHRSARSAGRRRTSCPSRRLRHRWQAQPRPSLPLRHAAGNQFRRRRARPVRDPGLADRARC